MLALTVDHSGRLGQVELSGLARVEAGTYFSASLKFTPTTALPAGAQLALARRWPSDWGSPQAIDPAAADYFTLVASDGTPLRWWASRLHTWHPFDHVLFVEALEPLAAGVPITLRFGDRSRGSPGARAQTFIEEGSPWSVRVCSGPQPDWTEIAVLRTTVVGTAPHRAVLSAPSHVRQGEHFELHLRIEDPWGNPASDFTGSFRIEGADTATGTVEVVAADNGAIRFPATIATTGVHRLRARHLQTGEVAQSNPVACDERVSERLYWGDLHAQSVIGCGARSIDAYLRHARDFAGCDFASHQANCFLVSKPEWRETEEVTARLHADRRFVTLLGVEWSAASHLGGDRNLYFSGDSAELHRCSHEFIVDRSDLDTDLPHADDLHRHYAGSDTLIALHVGGRTADLRWHHPQLERLLEVHSTHATSEWFLFEALERGYRMGVIAGSDGVDGRPGASHPGHLGVRNVRGGLVAVAMPSLTREALLAGLRARNCYATTGERILLELDADGHPMGSEFDAVQAPTLRIRVEGTAALESVEVFRGTQPVFRAPIQPLDATPSHELRVAWSGASAPGNWQRARMSWDGHFEVTGGRIGSARGWALDTPDEWVRADGESKVRWRSVTAGDWDGVVVGVEARPNAVLSFVTDPVTLTVPLARLAAGPFEMHAGNPQRRVRIEWLPKELPAPSWSGSFTDPAPGSGCNAYWVRVRQHDGAFAWSSPVFVTLPARER